MEGCAIQKLIYENLARRDGRVFSCAVGAGPGEGRGHERREGSGRREGAYQQGESVTGLRREGRTVKVTLHLLAPSRQEMYRLRAELLGVPQPGQGLRRDEAGKAFV